jgi:predicted DsbA family dithiol-disulfide isomerase
VLEGLAADVGLDPDGARAVLGSDTHANEVRAEQRMAAQLGITGVPFFVVDERYAVSGAQPSEVLLQLFERAWSEGHPSLSGAEAEAGDAPGCGPDGCAV